MCACVHASELQVTIVTADMRTWQAPEPADILVSELLGSFGDNELSPECLDGAQRFLGPDGISIPANYTRWGASANYTRWGVSACHSRRRPQWPLLQATLPVPRVVHSTLKCCAARPPLGPACSLYQRTHLGPATLHACGSCARTRGRQAASLQFSSRG